jgi:hypothetical protein
MSITGILTVEPTTGLGVRYGSGQVGGAVWPFGYWALRDQDGVVLHDRQGHLVAREGDRIRMSGWIDSSNLVSHPCDPPEVEVLAPASTSAVPTPIR